jgi:hypothetical protein
MSSQEQFFTEKASKSLKSGYCGGVPIATLRKFIEKGISKESDIHPGRSGNSFIYHFTQASIKLSQGAGYLDLEPFRSSWEATPVNCLQANLRTLDANGNRLPSAPDLYAGDFLAVGLLFLIWGGIQPITLFQTSWETSDKYLSINHRAFWNLTLLLSEATQHQLVTAQVEWKTVSFDERSSEWPALRSMLLGTWTGPKLNDLGYQPFRVKFLPSRSVSALWRWGG